MSNNKHLEYTRNLSVIAHVDAGKSSLCDTLLACGKIISDKDAGAKRMMSARDDEKERGITIVSSGATIHTSYHGNICANQFSNIIRKILIKIILYVLASFKFILIT
jgi:translation elongation factor EF-G